MTDGCEKRVRSSAAILIMDSGAEALVADRGRCGGSLEDGLDEEELEEQLKHDRRK